MARKRKKPELSVAERARRTQRAKRILVPAAIKATGRKGFRETVKALAGKPKIESPEKLAGWLKKEALHRGQLSSAHPYTGRRKRRKGR